jgi:hypothetical protein
MRFADLLLRLQGATSGETIIKAAAAASGTITLPAGTTDFSGTGGTSQVVRQSAAGAPFTVGQLAASDVTGALTANQTITLSGDATGSGATAIPVTLATVNGNVGTFQGLTVNAKGLVTAAVNAGYLTSSGVSGMTAGQVPIAATATTVTSSVPTGTSGNSTVVQTNASGNLLAAVMPAYTGDVTSPAGSTVNTLPSVNSNVGTFQGLTVNAKGQVTAAANQSYLTSPVAVANGGTGATTAAAAAANLAVLPLSGGTLTGTLTLATYLANSSSIISYRTTTHQFADAPGTTQFAVFDATSTRNVSGSWATISTRELKQNITPYTRGLDAILALNPVAFAYRPGTPFSGPDAPSDPLIGLIAEEVEPHIPEIVGEVVVTIGKEDRTVQTISPSNLVYALINAAKDLAARVEALEARLASVNPS